MNVKIYKDTLKSYNMTYEDLAKETGLSIGCIRKIMAGIAKHPRAETIEAIEKALGINTFSPKEHSAGLTETRKVEITPIEDDMLYVFRQIGLKHGEPGQLAILEVAKKML